MTTPKTTKSRTAKAATAKRATSAPAQANPLRDPALHQRVCAEVREWLESGGWSVQGVVESPITGPEGNVEFLIAARRG